MDKYKDALKEVLLNLRSITGSSNKDTDMYINDSIEIIKNVLLEDESESSTN